MKTGTYAKKPLGTASAKNRSTLKPIVKKEAKKVKKPYQQKLKEIKSTLLTKQNQNAILIQRWFRRILKRIKARYVTGSAVLSSKLIVPQDQLIVKDYGEKVFNKFANSKRFESEIKIQKEEPILEMKKPEESGLKENSIPMNRDLEDILYANKAVIGSSQVPQELVEPARVEKQDPQLEVFMKKLADIEVNTKEENNQESLEKFTKEFTKGSLEESQKEFQKESTKEFLEESLKKSLKESLKESLPLPVILEESVASISTEQITDNPQPLPCEIPSFEENQIEVQPPKDKIQAIVESIELTEANNTIQTLKQALENERNRQTKWREECAKQEILNLEKQKKEFEMVIERQVGFIDQLINDKKELTETCESYKRKLKEDDQGISKKIKEIEAKHATELKKNKEAWMAAEKVRREKWEKEKTQEIKLNTTKTKY